jgi:formylglycine-generating enzyme required for sulfatase activity
MNNFETGINEARLKQYCLYIVSFVILLIGCGVLLSLVAFTNGTSVKIAPEDAEKSGNVSVIKGAGFSLFQVVYGFSDSYAVEVSSPGFQSIVRPISPKERGGSVLVTLQELPGQLVVKTNPLLENTRVFVNSNLVAMGIEPKAQLKAGTYNIEINNPFYRIDRKSVEVQRAQTTTVAVTFEKVDGEIEILSTPIGAALTFDEKEIGKTPQKIKTQGGDHPVRLEINDHLPIDDIITVTNSSAAITRNYQFKRIPALLTFTLSPLDGKLMINGKIIDLSKTQEVESKIENSLTYFKEGYFEETKKLTFSPNEKAAVAFNLQPNLGRVEIRSDPKANVIANGKKIGETPLSIRLPAVPQKIVLQKEGYRSVEKIITPSSKQTISIQESLITEVQARLASSPNEYKNKAGIEFVLFVPNRFEMGAPRHEKGQRANEFVRQVELNKPFYAAKHEISIGQYSKFKQSQTGPANNPVTNIRWIDAASFCNWLSVNEGFKQFYKIDGETLQGINSSSDGYRLLTEAEWEWIARKANKDKQTIFPWGNELIIPDGAGNVSDESAKGATKIYVPNYNDGFPGISPIGSFKAEMSGLFDIFGNVSEWVHDFYSLSPPSPHEVLYNPMGPTTGDGHVVKGANWKSGSLTQLRPAYRDTLTDKRDDVGFRIGRYIYGGNVD